MNRYLHLLFLLLSLNSFGQRIYDATIESETNQLSIVKVDSVRVIVNISPYSQFRTIQNTHWEDATDGIINLKVPTNRKISIQLRDNNKNTSYANIIIKSIEKHSLWFYVSFVLFLLSIVWLIVRIAKYKFALERLNLENELQIHTERTISLREKYETLLEERLTIEEAKELKLKSKARRYKMVTVLFSDIKGFSKLTSKDDPEKLVDDLDKFFFKFDQTVKKYNIQKIKTVGDTYMCAGGIPNKNRTNPIDVVLAAFEMQQYMEKLKLKYPDSNNRIWGLRIGIHTGPVFAGKEGLKKHSYDIWGETVNIASRMQSSGEIGKINISSATYELVRDYFSCNYHGKMPVKFKGDVEMFFIEGFKSHLASNEVDVVPNDAFYLKLAFIRFDDLEEEVLDLLEKKLPKNLYYHNIKHTIDVVTQVELIGRKENISDKEMLILKTAALFHDLGFVKGYKDHELLGIKMAKEILPKHHYNDEQIIQICDLIYSTKLPPEPKNVLERIICDADLDYLGRADFIPVSESLFKELVEHKIIENDYNKWNIIQEKFIESHQYYTDTARNLRDVNKKKQLENIRKQII